jgi:copper(I)-binding protein
MKILTALFLSVGLMITTACLPEKDKTKTASLPVIEITELYAFATMPGAATGAAFMTLTNTSDIDDVLISIESNLAKFTEIHQNMIDPDDGTMMMRKIKQIDIPSGNSVLLKPTGYHVMFIKLKEPLTLNSTVDITLNFEKSGAQKVTVQIKPPGMTPHHGAHH